MTVYRTIAEHMLYTEINGNQMPFSLYQIRFYCECCPFNETSKIHYFSLKCLQFKFEN